MQYYMQITENIINIEEIGALLKSQEKPDPVSIREILKKAEGLSGFAEKEAAALLNVADPDLLSALGLSCLRHCIFQMNVLITAFIAVLEKTIKMQRERRLQ
ncbi:MAG: hypothetical protein HY034_07835 [Nitrospirae bacterium]|nr:hypothetical protein [Nitrospirota bacterium]